MPLTRRVQVFIGPEASEALDILVEGGLTQREAIERGLLDLLNTKLDTSAPAIFAEFVRNGAEQASKIATNSDEDPTREYALGYAGKDSKPLERAAVWQGGGATCESTPANPVPQSKLNKPLERKQVVPIPKPGRKK